MNKPLKIKPVITLDAEDAEARRRIGAALSAQGLPDNDMVLDSYIYRIGLKVCSKPSPATVCSQQPIPSTPEQKGKEVA